MLCVVVVVVEIKYKDVDRQLHCLTRTDMLTGKDVVWGSKKTMSVTRALKGVRFLSVSSRCMTCWCVVCGVCCVDINTGIHFDGEITSQSSPQITYKHMVGNSEPRFLHIRDEMFVPECQNHESWKIIGIQRIQNIYIWHAFHAQKYSKSNGCVNPREAFVWYGDTNDNVDKLTKKGFLLRHGFTNVCFLSPSLSSLSIPSTNMCVCVYVCIHSGHFITKIVYTKN